MADSAGYVGRVLGLSWKAQSEPEAVIGGYAEHQARGLGPVSISFFSCAQDASHSQFGADSLFV